ncbi:PcfB family protein [bacterium D16-51]|nr:PcfB family protein [bacterium D16-59]RKI60061.1 PcfB family protein [bacterium D16-51]
MSEIADAVQIIRVTYDGIEIAMKVGSASIRSMQKALDLIVGMLEHEKEMGKTNLKGLLAKGGDIQVLSFADEDLKKFRKLAKKYGILYSEMPDAGRDDGLTEVMFHSEAAPRMRMMSQKLQDGRVFNMDEYLKSGNEEKLNQLLRYLENEKNGKPPRKLHADETVRADHAIDGLIQKIGHYAVEKKTVSVEAVRADLQVGADEAEKAIGQLAKIGVLDRADEAGNYRVIMEREAFDRRISRYQELSSRMRQIAASKNTSLMDITITKKLVAQENECAVKTRVPGMYGQSEGYLWINKADIMEIHNGKTLLTYLDKNKEYKIYSADNRVIRTIKGEELYSGHYDKVEAAVRQRYQAARQQPAKTAERVRRR